MRSARSISRLAMALLGSVAVVGASSAQSGEGALLRAAQGNGPPLLRLAQALPQAAPSAQSSISSQPSVPIVLAADIGGATPAKSGPSIGGRGAGGASSSSATSSNTQKHDETYRRWRDSGRLPGDGTAAPAAPPAPTVTSYPLSPWPSLADQLPSMRVNYFVIDQPLERVLVELGALAGITIQPSRMHMTIKSQRFEGPFNEVVDRLMQQQRLVAMREGTKIIVASDAETTVRYIKASPAATPERIAAALRLAGVSNVDGRVVMDAATGLIQITMPGVIGDRVETILVNATAISAGDAAAAAQQAEPTMIKFGKVLK